MEKLTIKELAPYLPYGTELKWVDEIITIQGVTINNQGVFIHCTDEKGNNRSFYNNSEYDIKLILRPLSDLTKDENFELYLELCEELGVVRCEHLLEALMTDFRYTLNIKKYQILEEFMYKNHFDWKFGLIEKGLAIDKNTI